MIKYIPVKAGMLLALVLPLALLFIFDHPVSAQDRPEFVKNELLVKFHEGATNAQIKKMLTSVGAETLHKFKYLKLRKIRIPEAQLHRARVVLSRRVEVAYAEFNYYRYFDLVPDDTMYTDMWGLENTGQTGGTVDADIDAEDAWDISTGHGDVVVAVIDSGIDLDHEDLAGNLWTNPGEIPGNNIDDDENGYVDDVHGWDFSTNDNDPSDDVTSCGGHGTHTAGTIGAVGDNGTGITGINWNVKLMPLKTSKSILFGLYCGLEDADIIEAIEYATANGAQVSNNSYGGGGYSQAVADAIQAASHLFVAAAGNEDSDNDAVPSYPANYNLDRIISVAATDHDDALASFSNYGVNTVDLAAPGVSILSTLPGDNYGAYSGTSMASPHVAGVAALMLSADPALTHNEIKWRILQSTDYIDIPTATGGRLNASNALTMAPADVAIQVTPMGDTSVSPGDTIFFNVVLENNSGSDFGVAADVVAVLPDGTEVLVASRSMMLSAGQSLSRNLSYVISAGAAPGIYTLMGRAEVPGSSFDEDPVTYIIE